MKKIVFAVLMMAAAGLSAAAQEFNDIPLSWKWISDTEAAFTMDGSYVDEDGFTFNAAGQLKAAGVAAPELYTDFPLQPDSAVNLTYSPDSTRLAFTRGGNLFVADIASGTETQLTFDGNDLILNGYASWVYYEEILGRPSQYRAFWWSPDSQKIGFYRFDNTSVPMFPIYSPFGQDGSLKLTRYPKAGEPNPQVRIGIIDLKQPETVVWADFDETEDQYFGIPFWGADSRGFFVAREPRLQHELDLYRVSVEDGSKKHIYHEYSPTWLDWPEEMQFGRDGLYMVRSFETGWEQIYYLSYDGNVLKRLTDGTNWRTSIVRVDEKTGTVYFTSNRDDSTMAALYKVDSKGNITALTDPSLGVSGVTFSPDGRYFIASLSNYTTPTQIRVYENFRKRRSWTVADRRGPDYDATAYALPQLIHIDVDGFSIPAAITYPLHFDPSRQYPVHMEIYGGPNTAYVRQRWSIPDQWWSDNDIIHIVADTRVAGHNGKAGTDLDFRNLTAVPVRDFVAWADWLQAQPYVIPDKIGVEGFSFGGTMTALLLFEHSDKFHYGIAGGGVYDWMFYDSHYTERFMETPQTNPEGYSASCVLNSVSSYPVTYDNNDGSVMLKLTHGTGDDNVHFQNTLRLIDELQMQGKCFDLMIYPDGLHGYRGAQGRHSTSSDRSFWLLHLTP